MGIDSEGGKHPPARPAQSDELEICVSRACGSTSHTFRACSAMETLAEGSPSPWLPAERALG